METEIQEWGDRGNKLPLCSIIIPCRNESGSSARCLESILANDYPHDRLEVLVVDGMSEDGTRAIVEAYAQRYPSIRLVNNPKRITPAALNLGIAQAKGTIIIRMDAHAEYPPHFISTCTAYLNSTGADVVGGPVITKPAAGTLIARTIALVTSHPFGVGNSKFRTSQEEGFVDTVPFGAYRREVFDRVGLFDERLVRNQDNEFSSRIIKNGGKIYLTPELTACYYNQMTLKGLLRQALRTGMWNVMTIRINPAAFRWRHFVPFLFITGLLALGSFAAMFSWSRFAFLILIGLYGCAAVVSSLQIGLRAGMRFVPFLPIMFSLYHVCYGFGTWVGLLKIALNGWDGTSRNQDQSA